MDHVRLGASGLHVSRVCLGMMSHGNNSDRPDLPPPVHGHG
jgi:aryl-alcohol dehydrogenase-like predicted oxidoreductase